MSEGQIIYYDYEHCRDFLEQRARDLQEKAEGLETLATFRELLYGFSYEALDKQSLVLGQFDTGVVFLFSPWDLEEDAYPQGHETARSKALDLLGAKQAPLVLELLDAQSERATLSDHGRMETWMREEFLRDVVLARKVSIRLFFDGGAFFEQVMQPELLKHGFQLMNSYEDSAMTGFTRVRHSARPGRVFKLPWVAWVREMMGGGFNVIYPMACFSLYLQKLDEAVR